MSDNIADGSDDLVIAFDGPRGRTQLSFSNELLTGPVEKFVSHLQAAEFDFDPSRVEDLREYLIGRRDGKGGVLANYEFRQPKTSSARATASPTDDVRPVTLGEARRALIEASESGVRALEGENARGLQRLQDAFREAKEGRLFVVENLPTETVSAREADACAAFRSGDLRPPFPNTFILATISGVQGPYLLGVKENDVTKGGFSHLCIVFSVVRENGRIVWRTLPGGSPDWERFQICTVVTLSLIVDSRVSVLPIKTDDKLNKARVKSGKPAIPPYFFIAPPGPTVLVPGSAPKPATVKGGTHASPRPHDRRGHPRNLKSGRTVWVRDCKINALIPHLTRDRSYYEIKLNGAAP